MTKEFFATIFFMTALVAAVYALSWLINAEPSDIVGWFCLGIAGHLMAKNLFSE